MVFSKAAQMEEPVYSPASPAPGLTFLYKIPLVNAPGKTLIGVRVDFPPSAATPPHTHRGAFVAVHVLAGTLLNKMNDDPMEIKRAGDSFHENPGCRHRISTNASDTEPASLLATFVIDTHTVEGFWEEEGMGGLVIVDEEWLPVIEEFHRQKS